MPSAVCGSNDFTFVERSPAFALDPARNWGVGFFSYSDDERATLAGGAYRTGTNNTGDDVGDGNDMAYTARATALERYRALPPQDLSDVEYWDLEQAKLRRGGKPPMFAGEIALVTGAASGIGKACVESLMARGASVVALDIDPGVATMKKRPDFLGLACDVTSEEQIANALEHAVEAFGGLDMLVAQAQAQFEWWTGHKPADRVIREAAVARLTGAVTEQAEDRK